MDGPSHAPFSPDLRSDLCAEAAGVDLWIPDLAATIRRIELIDGDPLRQIRHTLLDVRDGSLRYASSRCI